MGGDRGLFPQFFVNMEVERYTLATGETAVTGFQRLWKPLGIKILACAIIPNMWPAWATSASTATLFIFGGDRQRALDRDPRDARDRRRAERLAGRLPDDREDRVRQGRPVLVFLVVALVAAVNATAWGELDQVVTSRGQFPGELDFALLLGALAFAGAGGTNNLVVSNWIRDKGYGMGKYAPRIVSPISGEEEAAPSGQGYVFKPDEENMGPLAGLVAEGERRAVLHFFLIAALAIIVFSLVARATVYGKPTSERRVRLHRGSRATRSRRSSAPRFGTLFWAIGAVSLFARRARDRRLRLAPGGRRAAAWATSTNPSAGPRARLYFVVAWGISPSASRSCSLGFDQPLTLVVLAACAERHRDVHLLRAADRDQPQVHARGAEDPRRPARDARDRVPDVRRAVGDRRHRPVRELL